MELEPKQETPIAWALPPRQRSRFRCRYSTQPTEVMTSRTPTSAIWSSAHARDNREQRPRAAMKM
ncbi:MAG: hypothetical protein QG671_4518, partial [Actinomycetota bacterium]|nr:hypothetical protein [Actinomycetota bacterium]